jgi:UrcA family protein
MFSTKHRARSLLFTLTAAGALLTVVPATAAPIDEIAEIRVDYSDLDLTSTIGLETLYGRILSASIKVCPAMPPGQVDLAVKTVIRDCRTAAVDRTIAEIANPQLAAVHAVAQKRS